MLESLFNKDVVIQACNFIKKRLQQRCFTVNIAKFSRTPILKKTCEWLLIFEGLPSLGVKICIVVGEILLHTSTPLFVNVKGFKKY